MKTRPHSIQRVSDEKVINLHTQDVKFNLSQAKLLLSLMKKRVKREWNERKDENAQITFLREAHNISRKNNDPKYDFDFAISSWMTSRGIQYRIWGAFTVDNNGANLNNEDDILQFLMENCSPYSLHPEFPTSIWNLEDWEDKKFELGEIVKF